MKRYIRAIKIAIYLTSQKQIKMLKKIILITFKRIKSLKIQ